MTSHTQCTCTCLLSALGRYYAIERIRAIDRSCEAPCADVIRLAHIRDDAIKDDVSGLCCWADIIGQASEEGDLLGRLGC
jgi:hypothetical protein